MSGLYTATEAREKLGGIAAASLQRLVDAGKIKKVIPPENKRRGYYDRDDVDRLAEAMQEFIDIHAITPRADKLEFVQAQNESDIKATVHIARQNLGDNAYDLEKRMAWFNKAPKGDYVLKHNGIIVGYFSMQAIKPETVEHIFNRKSGSSVQLEDMEPITPGRPLEVHVSGIGVKKGISQDDARKYGRELLVGLFNLFTELGKQGIVISKIWGKSSTVPGIKLSKDLGFKELGYINNEQIGFVLDLTTLEKKKPLVKKYLQRYQEALEHWNTPRHTTVLHPKNEKVIAVHKQNKP